MTSATQTLIEPSTSSVDRRCRLPYAEFESDYLLPNKPVVLTGCMDDWPALTKWSPEFFQQKHGAAPVNVGGRTRPLAEFIDLVLASCPEKPAPYLKDVVVRQLSADLMKDI